MSSATMKWIGLALLGVAIAGGVAFAASRLVSEQIGIASEEVSAGAELAPALGSAARRRADDGREAASRGRGNAGDRDAVRPTGQSGEGEAGDPGPTPSGPSVTTDPDAREDELDALRDAEEDRRDEALDAAEDQRKEAEDAAEDRLDAIEDARDD